MYIYPVYNINIRFFSTSNVNKWFETNKKKIYNDAELKLFYYLFIDVYI